MHKKTDYEYWRKLKSWTIESLIGEVPSEKYTKLIERFFIGVCICSENH